ncbi:MAG: 3-dehydroquinate dehydratase [Alphaproteobacteria bacterium MarineAlpha5_Bin9]|nr:MAG: 3-dehydroquinate dehydratase [Alphaproteobacteria bacterium MarineAlpha5_Bin9]|tara:strand:+ start:23693 stop:24124 length:432 start_codon:yes stop_codon:yes gene_type:complete
MKKIIIINGPNLNLLGIRETKIYGKSSLEDIKKISINKCNDLNLNLSFVQSNSESEIIDYIHKTEKDFDGLIINPAAYTHTSLALLDALKAISKPKIEIHISNIYSREEYRKKSLTSSGVDGIICGFGPNSYILAIEAIKRLI